MSGLKLFSLGSLDITTGGSSVNVADLTEVGTSIVKGLESTGLTLDSGSSIYFDTNESNKMVITPDGSVGIGTSNPISELAVAGKIAITSELGASLTLLLIEMVGFIPKMTARYTGNLMVFQKPI